MEDAVWKSKTLIEALPYIKQFRHRFVVIKLGGSAQDDDEVLRRIFVDIDFMFTIGLRPVVVHGGGKRISNAMKENGLEPEFIHGQRRTDAATMEIVARVLADEVSARLVQLMRKAGGRAEPLNGRDQGFLRAIPKTIPEVPEADLGFVGEPVAIDATDIYRIYDRGAIPFIAPVACGCGHDSNTLYNINGDTASALIARDLHAEKLVFFLDTAGIYADKEEPQTLLSHCNRRQIEEMMRAQTIAGGMVPKVQAGLFALEGGVRKVHIVSGAQPHALLMEIFTDKGIGTEIVL